MKLDTSAYGVDVIAPPPFDADGRINDASKLSYQESVDIVKRVIRRARLFQRF